MQKKNNLFVITKTKDLAKYIITVTEKSPKKFRFTLVVRLQNYVLDAMEEEYLANASTKEAVDMGKGYARLCRFVCHPWWWWLRSPNYNNSNNAREVNNNGNANNNNVNNTNNGVVPDLLLSKEKRSVREGTYFRLYDGTL